MARPAREHARLTKEMMRGPQRVKLAVCVFLKHVTDDFSARKLGEQSNHENVFTLFTNLIFQFFKEMPNKSVVLPLRPAMLAFH